ncbi:MAG: chain-length determining protein [Bacteroidaceae bacterium]|nr:chain-length determining protein [Bacteroidaceae bacterium]
MANQKDLVDNTQIEKIEEEDSGIDFTSIYAALKDNRRLYVKVLPIVFILSCIIVLSLPNYYQCEVQLAPELSGGSSSMSMLGGSALRSLLGARGAGVGSDALNPTLYPDLVNSTDFKVSLFDIPVHKMDSTRVTTYYDYLTNGQKSPWWSSAIKGTIGWVAYLIAGDDADTANVVNPFQLTKEQAEVVKGLEKIITCDVDDKTLVITISITDQDPFICAMMADSVRSRLQDFITAYRTKKARVDLDYTQNLYDSAKVAYDLAREEYATYADANQDLIYQTDRTTLNNLENEMQLQFNNFNMLAQQLQTAKAKVQEETPSFTTLQSATVPVEKAGPGRTKIVLIIMLLAFLGTSAWVLYREGQLKSLLGMD